MTSVRPCRILWFRRDLRLDDHPALAEAADGSDVVGLFVADPRLLDDSVRTARLAASVAALDAQLDGALVVRFGAPAEVVPAAAAECGAASVHVSADFAPYGKQRDDAVAAALGPVPLVTTGSPYAISPGRVRKGDGTPYRVYTPFYRAWLAHGWRAPAPSGADSRWHRLPGDGAAALLARTASAIRPAEGLAPAGEAAAHQRWREFRASALARYGTDRDRPDLPGTSGLGAHLRFGEVHPRTLLADLGDGEGDEAFRREIAFREFYADVLWHNPGSARASLDRRFDQAMDYDEGSAADAAFAAWTEGRTGYPFVDAGMRQLLAQGWVHNRVRMVVASFLVKDLLLPWWRGAAWFMDRLADGDLASNTAGWQWVAGCGTDAAPYHRIFNPVAQGKRFDPAGDYIRRYVPELRGIAGAAVHEPWSAGLFAPDYPAPIVDHAAARNEALARFATMKARAQAG